MLQRRLADLYLGLAALLFRKWRASFHLRRLFGLFLGALVKRSNRLFWYFCSFRLDGGDIDVERSVIVQEGVVENWKRRERKRLGPCVGLMSCILLEDESSLLHVLFLEGIDAGDIGDRTVVLQRALVFILQMIGSIVLKSLLLEHFLRRLMLNDDQLGLVLDVLLSQRVGGVQGLANVDYEEAVLVDFELRGQLRGHDLLDGEVGGKRQLEGRDVPADGFEVDVECRFG